jgi:transcriptional regulator of acetoin/glycerol metabolism
MHDIAPARHVAPSVLESWRRCLLNYNLDPEKPGETIILSQRELAEHQQPHGQLLRVARPILERLYGRIEESEYCVLFTDGKGVAIDYLGQPSLEAELKRCGLYLGSVWAEDIEGTNGVGTCLTVKEAITVHRTEHFRAKNTGLTCTVAPVFDPFGNLMAVLDVSSMSVESRAGPQLAQQLVNMASCQIESVFFLEEFSRHWILRLFPDQHELSPLNEGLLALSPDGRIRAANRIAGRWRKRGSGQPLVGCRIEDIFRLQPEELWRSRADGTGSVFTLMPRGSDQPVFALLTPPRQPAKRPPQPARSKATTIEEDELTLDRLAGRDPQLVAAVDRIQRTARYGLPMLLLGDTGVGKEAFARASHRQGRYPSGPFVAINCGALPASLLESELFGYEAGSFTGASRAGKQGLLAAANGGTLFLDEIGEMPIEAQTRLLRVLSEREVTMIGRTAPIKVEFDLICATNRDLGQAVAAGRFREDLYYRIAGHVIRLPPVRQRADRAELIESIFLREARLLGRAEAALSPEALQLLAARPWHGNVREVRNIARLLISLVDEDVLLPRHVTMIGDSLGAANGVNGPETAVDGRGGDAAMPAADDMSPDAARLIDALRRNQWCVTRTARELGVNRVTVHRRMRRLRITSPAKYG